MEKQEEGISFSREISLINQNLFDLVNAILDQFSPCVLENGVDAHYGIAADIEMSVIQILDHSLHEILKDTFDANLWNQPEGAAPNVLIGRKEILSECIAGQCDLILDRAVEVDLLNHLPIEEQELLHFMILQ